MKKLTLVEITKEVKKLPALPQTMIDIMTILDKPDSKINEIEKEILKDQGLAAKVLKMANSAFYRGRSSIETVVAATIVLGLDSVEALVMSSYAEEFLTREFKGYAYKREELWKQSFLSAVIAKKIAKEIKFPKPELAYTAGLLKDIGKVILDKYVIDYRMDIMNLMNEEDLIYVEAEKKILGFNYCQVGAKVAEKWNLSVDLIEAIDYQFNPMEASSNLKLVSIIYIVNMILLNRSMSSNIESKYLEAYEKTLDDLQLSKKSVDRIINDLKIHIDD